ncbi:Methyltransferase domain-containing protein [Pedococcus cremeus]|uniref:Methyltransferase domain-containing protein n=1 Tax=Pedococcus cremeus TaxID=587636 RepID=A0A1H9TEQ3_9MICO|nr:class I SAM-dependent methyltransferase [Pedococcus cremeus]SER95444.1 Methyltransferase domain-containing protein [Pedococcus cremeus]
MSSGLAARRQRALQRARRAAYGSGEYVGQEGFMRASEILDLASRAGVSPAVAVLDLCCGVAGPGRLIARTSGCDYLGVDADPRAIEVARQRAGGNCRFEVSRVPPLPSGQFDVVLLLETMLAFPDKVALMRAVSSALPPGGRFAFTIEAGHPLTTAERALMPAADTVWPTPLADLCSCLQQAGMRVLWQQDCTEAHHIVVEALVLHLGAVEREFGAGDPTLRELLTAHRIWSHWLRERRVRKLAFVTERRA